MEMDYWTYRQIVIKAAMHYHILESVKSGLSKKVVSLLAAPLARLENARSQSQNLLLP